MPSCIHIPKYCCRNPLVCDPPPDPPGTGVTTPCCPGKLPKTLTATLTTTGSCTTKWGNNRVFAAVYNAGTVRWEWSFQSLDTILTANFRWFCTFSGGVLADWTMQFVMSGSAQCTQTNNGGIIAGTCSPLNAQYALQWNMIAPALCCGFPVPGSAQMRIQQ